MDAMRPHESAENYLKAILILEHRNGSVRAVDIARHMGVSKPSVSKALENLRGQGFIEVNAHNICPTDKGRSLASSVLEQYLFFYNLLVAAGVDAKVAADEACSLEHCLSEESFRRLRVLLVEKIKAIRAA